MGQVVQFPTVEEMEWKFWEKTLRDTNKSGDFSGDVLEQALPKIKAHWKETFESLTLDVEPVSVPGTVSEDQALAIRRIGEVSADAVMKRLRTERTRSLLRLAVLELRASFSRVHQVPCPE
jgi:hypothetical protein